MAGAQVTVKFFGDETIRALEPFIRQAVNELGFEYVNRVRDLMRNSPATGRGYESGSSGTKIRHRASAPGEPPAPDTGQLVDSVTYQMRRTPEGWASEAGSRLAY